MSLEDRYWCHICKHTSPVYLSNNTRRCQDCDSDFVELIEYPNYNRFSSLRLVLQPDEDMSNSQLASLVEMLRTIEDRNIMELRETFNTESATQQTFEEDLQKERSSPICKEYFEKLSEQALETEDSCTICQDTIKTGLELSCGHLFHKDCISGWFEKSHSCPVCRKSYPAQKNI